MTAVFVDLQQAYDHVWRAGLLFKLQKMVLSSGEASRANSKITCFYYRKIWTAEGIGHNNVEMPVKWLKVVQAPLKVHVKWMTNSACS